MADLDIGAQIGAVDVARHQAHVAGHEHDVELEAVARKTGHAVGIGSISPVTIERIAAWVNGAERRGFVLAPVSSVVDVESGG